MDFKIVELYEILNEYIENRNEGLDFMCKINKDLT